MSKKYIIGIIIIVFISIIAIIQYNTTKKKYIYINFEEIGSQQLKCENINTTWIPILTISEAKNIEKMYNISLPVIDYNLNSLIMVVGKEMEKFYYNQNDPYLKTRGKYLGGILYKEQPIKNEAYFYVIKKLNIMETDEAGLPPNILP